MNDKLVSQAVIGLVGLVLVSLAGIIYLTSVDRTAPDVLEQAVTAGIVAIAGLLPGALNRKVEIQQPANEPVPVAETPARAQRVTKKATSERGQIDPLAAVVVVFVIVVIVLLLRGGF